MYKTKKELETTRKFVQSNLKLFAKEVRKSGLTMKTTLYVSDIENKKGNTVYYWYINACYNLRDYLETGGDTDSIVYKAMKKSVLGQYFEEWGSGGGFGGRDINFGQKKKIPC
jgi:hypothetical protein